MRSDLICDRQTYQGRDYWMIKDPMALKYYRFEEEEFALLKMLDGKASADEIQYQFNQRFAPQKLSLGELFQLVGTLYRSALLLSESGNQGRELFRRGDEARRRQARSQWTNVLAFQFRGFDPDGLLDNLNRRIGWFFSDGMLVCNLLLGLAALTLMLTHWSEVQNRLPGFHEFFHARNWFWLAGTLAITKVLHEFGHGIACKRFGGQCHELGVMLLVMTPCLYVNVSDAWTLPNKWNRIAIAAAGMYVELFLASICAFVWWYTQPGLLNQLALNAMFVCSVSTIVFNANPLMKYDGYYILSDLVEIPNLRQKSTALLQQSFNQWALGIEAIRDPFLPQRHRGFFVAYSVASVIYRWFVTISIFFFFYTVLEPHGFKIIGQLLALVVLFGLIVQPLIGAVRFFSIPGRMSQVKSSRAIVSSAVLGVLVLGVLLIPLPHYVRCGLYVQPANAATIYIKAPGRVRKLFAQPNQRIAAGDPILELDNPDLEFELAELAGQTGVARAGLRSAIQISNFDAKYSSEVDSAQARLVSTTNLATQRRKDLDNLLVCAPISGVLIAADYVPKPKDDDGKLHHWYGRVLEPNHVGAFLLEGTTVGQIVPEENQLEAILAIDQSDIEFVGPSQPVEIWVRQAPGLTLNSTIQQVSGVEMKAVPRCLAEKFGGDLATTTGPDDSERPTSSTYRVSVRIADPTKTIVAGSSGSAKIRVGYRTLGQLLWRLVCKTVRFDL